MFPRESTLNGTDSIILYVIVSPSSSMAATFPIISGDLFSSIYRVVSFVENFGISFVLPIFIAIIAVSHNFTSFLSYAITFNT